jgi:hypothetical protein
MARSPVRKRRKVKKKLDLSPLPPRKPLWGWWDNAMLGLVLIMLGLLVLSHYWEKVVASVH